MKERIRRWLLKKLRAVPEEMPMLVPPIVCREEKIVELKAEFTTHYPLSVDLEPAKRELRRRLIRAAEEMELIRYDVVVDADEIDLYGDDRVMDSIPDSLAYSDGIHRIRATMRVGCPTEAGENRPDVST